jgi:hypothetical protein
MKKKKLHIACGDVYLDGFENLDIVGRVIHYGQPNPNLTTLGNYYIDRAPGKKRETIIDKRFDPLKKWDYADGSVDTIAIICALEHFPFKDAEWIIKEAYRVLAAGGTLMVDVPDLKKQVELYIDKDPEWCMELIYCNHKDKYSIHHWGYTRKTLKKLLGAKWSVKFGNIVEHIYPVIGCTAIKL